jgi:acyl carrier protein
MTEIPASRDRILEKIRMVLVKVSDRESTSAVLLESSKLREDLGLDSYAALELIFELEDQVGVRVSQEAAMSFKTVGDVVTYVLGALSADRVASSQPG